MSDETPQPPSEQNVTNLDTPWSNGTERLKLVPENHLSWSGGIVMQTAESVSLHPVLLDFLDQLLPNGYEITPGPDVQPPLPPDLMEITFGLPDEPYDAPPQVHGEMAALLWFIWFCHQITYKMDVDPHQVVRQQVTQWCQPTQDQTEAEPGLIHTITLMDRLEEF